MLINKLLVFQMCGTFLISTIIIHSNVNKQPIERKPECYHTSIMYLILFFRDRMEANIHPNHKFPFNFELQ